MAEQDQDQLFTPTIGERLRMEREKKKISMEDVARQTRIPVRHLQHLEREEWDALPGNTYSIGFVRSYGNALGLDGPALAAELREQIGGARAAVAPQYEPADPARVPPKSLALIAAVMALVLVGGYLIWRSSAVETDDPSAIAVAGTAEEPPASGPRPGPARPAPAAGPATGPVVLTASNDVWLRIYEGNGGPKLYEATLKAGESYQVPATAKAPQILTGRPDALTVRVGQTQIPPLGEPEKTISDVSLLPQDLVARARGTAPAPAPAPPAR